MDRDHIFKEIARLIREVYGVQELNIDTTINSFNAVSEENDEFLKRFQKQFDVDMNGFNYYDFFYEDQFMVLSLLRSLLHLFRIKKTKQDLTVKRLIDVASNKRWS